MEHIAEYTLLNFHMIGVFAIIISTIVSYVYFKNTLLVSMFSISFLAILFTISPLQIPNTNQYVDLAYLIKGLSNPFLLTIVSLMVIGRALIRTNVLCFIADTIIKITGNRKQLSIALILLLVMIFSAFLNNTPIVILFIPIMAHLSQKMKISMNKLMIPLSYSAILGGMLTIIGSSTNLLVSGSLSQLGLPPLGFFEFTYLGSIIVLVGMLYIIFIAPKLIKSDSNNIFSYEKSKDRVFISQITVDKDSPLIGEVIDNNNPIIEELDIEINMINRNGNIFITPFNNEIIIKKGDLILFTASRNSINQLIKNEMLTVHRNLDHQSSLAEIVVIHSSDIIGRTPKNYYFLENYNCQIIAINRKSQIIRSILDNTRIEQGDILLIQGKESDLMRLSNSEELIMVDWDHTKDLKSHNNFLAPIIFLCVIFTSIAKILPIEVASLIGMIAVLTLRLVPLKAAIKSLNPIIISTIVTSVAMSDALEVTGGNFYISQQIIELSQGLSPTVIVSIVFLFTALATNILSNNASAILFTPIAVNISLGLNVDPKMFIYAIIFASNSSFLTPISYQTNLLVMGPGNYKFSDYMFIGAPLFFMIFITYSLMSIFYF